MIKSVRILSVILIIQIILVAGMTFTTGGPEKSTTSKQYLAVDFNKLDKVTISGKGGDVTLSKTASGWVLPEYGGLAVSDKKINTFIDRLKALKTSWPVASTVSAAKRFELSKDNTQKTIVFFHAENKIQALALGSSPGFKKVHARLDDSDDIHAIRFAQHDAPSRHRDWFEKTLLKIEGKITQVIDPGFTLTGENDQWQVNPSSANQKPNDDEIKSYVDRFGNLTVDAMIADAEAKDILILTPTRSTKVTSHAGEVTFDFFLKDEKYYVKSSHHEKLFEIANYQAKPIVTAELSSLIEEVGTVSETEVTPSITPSDTPSETSDQVDDSPS